MDWPCLKITPVQNHPVTGTAASRFGLPTTGCIAGSSFFPTGSTPDAIHPPAAAVCVWRAVCEILKRNGAGPSSEFSTDPHRCRRSVSPRWTSRSESLPHSTPLPPAHPAHRGEIGPEKCPAHSSQY